MAYIDERNQAVDKDFQDRVMVAIVRAAIAISAEAPATENHTNRANYSNLVLRSPERYAEIMALGIATDSNVIADDSDANIYNAVSGQWNAYAGVI